MLGILTIMATIILPIVGVIVGNTINSTVMVTIFAIYGNLCGIAYIVIIIRNWLKSKREKNVGA